MTDAIVAGYDGTAGARDALALTIALADAAGRAPLLVCVVPSEVPEWEEAPVGGGELVTRRARALLDAAPAPAEFERRIVADESVARALRTLAEREAAAAIVVGCPDRTLAGRIEAGTVAERLLHGSPCAVALAPRGYAQRPRAPFRRILVGYADAAEASAALRTAGELARAADASVRVVSAVERPPAPGSTATARTRPHGDLDRALRALASTVRVEGRVVQAHPVDALLEHARDWADLIVVGSRGHGPARRVEVGSVSAGLLERADVPVLVVPRGADAELVAPSSLAVAEL